MMKNKKLTPVFLFVMAFCACLSVQIMFNYFDLLAGPAPQESKENSVFEEAFKSTQVTDTQGNKISFPQIKAPIVIVNFWASWCRPCLEEFPTLVKLASKYGKDQITIIGVNSDEEDQKTNIAKISKKYGVNFTIVADRQSEIVNKYKISAIPVSIIYHNGKVIEVGKGAKDFMAEELLGKFDDILKNAKK